MKSFFDIAHWFSLPFPRWCCRYFFSSLLHLYFFFHSVSIHICLVVGGFQWWSVQLWLTTSCHRFRLPFSLCQCAAQLFCWLVGCSSCIWFLSILSRCRSIFCFFFLFQLVREQVALSSHHTLRGFLSSPFPGKWESTMKHTHARVHCCCEFELLTNQIGIGKVRLRLSWMAKHCHES